MNVIGLDDASYVVDVEFSTHDALKDGVVATGMHRVVVLAPDAVTAELTACEMVSCHAMPTSSRVILCTI